MRKPVAGGELGEEVGAFEVYGDDFVKNFLFGIEDVGTDAWGDAGVVDEGVEVAEGGEGFFDDAGAVGGEADIATDDGERLRGVGGEFRAGGGGFFGGGMVGGVVDGDAVAACGEGEGNATAKAAAGAGDENGGGYLH